MKKNSDTDTAAHAVCTKLLKQALETDQLSPTDESKVRQALKWHTGQQQRELTLIEWMTVLRVVGSDLTLRLDTEDKYLYLQFEPERNKTVVNDPDADTSTPLERTDIADEFDHAVKELYPDWHTPRKTYKAVTAVETQTDDPQLVYGEYQTPFRTSRGPETNQNTAGPEDENNGNGEWFYPKTTFELPEPMTPTEIQNWIADGGDDTQRIRKIIERNESRDWGDRKQDSSDNQLQ